LAGSKNTSQIDRLDAERLLYLLGVVAEPDRAPHVVGGILIARVVLAGAVGHDIPHVGDVRQLGFVELLEDARLDLAGQEICGRHHDIVARTAGQQLGLEDLVGVEHVIGDLDTGLLGEILDDRRIDVIRPVVDVDDLFLCLRGKRYSSGQKRRGRKHERLANHEILL